MPIVHVKAARGLSFARNKGLGVARGDFIAFPDDDCHYPRTLIEQVRQRFASRPRHRCSDRTHHGHGRATNSLSTFVEQDCQIDRWNVWRCGNSNTVFVRRSAIARGLRFNEELGVGSSSPFQSGEETAFLLDAMAKGSRGRFCRDIVVYHDQVGETDALRARKYARGLGRVLALYDYPLAYLARSVVRPALRAALGLASLNLRLARYKMLWALGVYEGYTGRLWVKLAGDRVPLKASSPPNAACFHSHGFPSRHAASRNRTRAAS